MTLAKTPEFTEVNQLHLYQLSLLEKLLNEITPKEGNSALKYLCQLICVTYGHQFGVSDLALGTMLGLVESDQKTALVHIKNITSVLRKNYEDAVSSSTFLERYNDEHDEDETDYEDDEDYEDEINIALR